MTCPACGQGNVARPPKCFGCSNPVMATDDWTYAKVRGVCTPFHTNCKPGG